MPAASAPTGLAPNNSPMPSAARLQRGSSEGRAAPLSSRAIDAADEEDGPRGLIQQLDESASSLVEAVSHLRLSFQESALDVAPPQVSLYDHLAAVLWSSHASGLTRGGFRFVSHTSSDARAHAHPICTHTYIQTHPTPHPHTGVLLCAGGLRLPQ